jgi:hypothetical protein
MKTIISFASALTLLLCLPGLPFAADTASDAAARQVATVFLQALGAKNLDQAVKVSDTPFITDDGKVLKSKTDVKAYLQSSLAGGSDDIPNAILGVVPYEKLRGVTDAKVLKVRDQILKAGDFMVGMGRNGMARGYLFVKVRGTDAAVVGIGM